MKDDDLSPELRKRLEGIQAEISLTKITMSFSLEQRQDNGRKMSVFYSANAVRRVEGLLESGAWSIEEARLAGCLLSKHVVETVYRDAVKRGVLSMVMARSEVPAILARYDSNIHRMLTKDESDDEDQS